MAGKSTRRRSKWRRLDGNHLTIWQGTGIAALRNELDRLEKRRGLTPAQQRIEMRKLLRRFLRDSEVADAG